MSSSLGVVEGLIDVGLRLEDSLYNSLELPDPFDGNVGAFGLDPLPLSVWGIGSVGKEVVDDEGEGAPGDVKGGQASCSDADVSPWKFRLCQIVKF